MIDILREHSDTIVTILVPALALASAIATVTKTEVDNAVLRWVHKAAAWLGWDFAPGKGVGKKSGE